jgi:hypothetical protein
MIVHSLHMGSASAIALRSTVEIGEMEVSLLDAMANDCIWSVASLVAFLF